MVWHVLQFVSSLYILIFPFCIAHSLKLSRHSLLNVSIRGSFKWHLNSQRWTQALKTESDPKLIAITSKNWGIKGRIIILSDSLVHANPSSSGSFVSFYRSIFWLRNVTSLTASLLDTIPSQSDPKSSTKSYNLNTFVALSEKHIWL